MRKIFWLTVSMTVAPAACIDTDDVDSDDELSTITSELGNYPDIGASKLNQISSANGGLCLDYPLGLIPAGAPAILQQSPCNGGANQLWWFESMGAGEFRIHSPYDLETYTPMCLDVIDTSTAPGFQAGSGGVVQVFPCNNGPNQRWVPAANTTTHGVIRPALNSSVCLDVAGASTGIAPVQLFTCGAVPATNRLWKFRTRLYASSLGPICTGNISVGGLTIIPGGFGAADVPAGTVSSGTCSSAGSPPWFTSCPAATNYMTVNRYLTGTGRFSYSCFQR